MEEVGRIKETLSFQFDIAMQLLKYHLNDLEDEETLWKPSPDSLYVHEVNGQWIADWPETEAYQNGHPSIAWLTWHIIFWWSMVFNYSFEDASLQREDIKWPGSIKACIEQIDQFEKRWLQTLDEMSDEDLFSSDKVKWPFEDLPFYQLAGWLNLELMKNATEIGSVRFMYGGFRE